FKVDRAAKMARVHLITGITIVFGLKIANISFSLYYYSERNSRYKSVSWISYLYIIYFSLINSFVICYMVATFYLLASVSMILFEQIYTDFRRRVIIQGRTDLIRSYFKHFTHLCWMVHQLNQYIYV